MDVDVSVIVPTFGSPTMLPRLVERVIDCDWFTSDSELVIIDDGNGNDTWRVILRLVELHSHVRGLRLGRNSGQHAALLAGIRTARNPVIVTLDDDLQNPPEEVSKMLSSLSDEVDVVYGLPISRRQSLSRNFASTISKRLMRYALGFEHATNISSFRVFRTWLRGSFDGNLGPGVSLDALLTWSTSRFTSVRVQHHARKAGKSNYNFWKLFRFMVDTVTGFSTVPLRIATGLGLATIALSVGVLLWVLGRPLITGESVPGFPFLAATIAIFSGTQLLVLGVIGQYIGRMHFRIMNKPTYTIAERTSN